MKHIRTILGCRRSLHAKSCVGISLFAVTALASAWVEAQAAAAVFGEGSLRIEKRPVMQPLRRLGLLPVAHNIAEARKALADQTTLRGILAQPLTPDDFALKLNANLKAVADTAGRFWTMDAIAGEGAAGRQAAGNEISNFQRAQLVKEYDLDGWLKADVYFTADHTAVRIALLGAQGSPVIAREDILLPSGADWDAINSAFAQSLGRMGQTIGHDGRVVFDNGDLLGVDVGIERGLASGTRLKAGLVLQSAAHPQTGEVLRYQRIPLLELEVVDAKQGASLCKKTALDPEMLKQAEANYGTGVDKKVAMLVWRDESVAAEPSWQAGRARADSTSAGFVAKDTPADENSARAKMVAPHQQEGARSAGAIANADASRLNPQVAMLGSSNPFAAPSLKQRGSAGGLGSGLKVSAGINKGTLSLSKGPVSSSLSSLLLNDFSVSDSFRYDSDWNAHWGVQFVNFSGNASGSRLTGRVGAMAQASALQLPDFPFQWGVEGQYSTGTVKTDNSKKTLDAFELVGVIASERNFDGGWKVGGELKPSITGLLSGAVAYEFGVEVYPATIAPKELSVQLRYWNDGDKWTEMSLGVNWKLGALE
ncbi:hypothetical protein EBU99_04950 [bacterium]|nr:hypothetical protein [bacterium]